MVLRGGAGGSRCFVSRSGERRSIGANFRLGSLRDAVFHSAFTEHRFGIDASLASRASFADCFAIELAARVIGTILAADHHEFDALVRQPEF
jgi:hypothetical protein